MTAVVVDASFAAAWFLPEAHQSAAAVLRRHPHRLFAPEFLQVELANILWKKIERREFDRADLPGALADVRSFDITWKRDADLVLHAAGISIDQHHSVYDCLYLALAQREDAQLATIDRRLIALAERLIPAVQIWAAPAN